MRSTRFTANKMNFNSMTNYGREMFDLLKETNSVEKLMDYMRINNIFQDSKASDRDDYLFDYRIFALEWEKITGISRKHIQYLPLITDGTVELDRYMDADYYDGDGEVRFVYIAKKP